MNVRQSKSSVQNKLSDYLQIPKSIDSHKSKQPNINPNKNRRLYTQETQNKQKNFVCTSSFYDNFQFVDRLTNNKLAYKDARKSCGSSLQYRRTTSKIQDRSHLHNLLEIYKKTKHFQMKNLRKRIFKNIDRTNQNQQIKTNHSLQFNEGNKKKTKKLTTILPQQSSSAEFFMYQSHKKNKLRSFIDRTITQINKSELNRIITEGDFNTQEEIFSFNYDKNKIKCNLDKNKIDELIYFREKQQFQQGMKNRLNQKKEAVVFKQMTNQRKKQENDENICQNQNEKPNNRISGAFQTQKKKKKTIQPNFEDQFLQNMINYTKKCLKKEGEFLVVPSRQNERKNMLMKSRKNKYALNNYRRSAVMTQVAGDLSEFTLQKRLQSQLIKDLKQITNNNKQDQKSIIDDKISISIRNREKNLIHLLKNNYVSNLSLQLMESQCGCMGKDEKGNNLLHLAVKQDLPEAMEIILKKVDYKSCMQLLSQRNLGKRTPLELAKMLVNRSAIQIIEEYVNNNKQKQIIQGWINTFKNKQNQTLQKD